MNFRLSGRKAFNLGVNNPIRIRNEKKLVSILKMI
jgi:hypothetical protein